MQVTDELRVLVEAEVARAIENFKKLEGSVGGAEKKTESLGAALDSVSQKSIILSGIIAGAGIAAVKFAGENEKLKLSLKNMLGSAEEASTVFEDWRRLGASPGLSTDEVFSLGRAMVNAGHDAAYATETIQMLGDVAAGTGGSFGTISGSFEHVRAQGKLTTRDLVSLQQQGIPVLKQLAKELGTSEDGVRRLAEKGKLGFSDLEKAFKGMTSPGGQFAGMMDELSGTVLEKFNTATDDAKQALASFGELMLPMATELLDGASSILRGINDMDEGTKRFVLGMGGVVAISGPAISAIKGISAAMATVAANPYILAIGGAIAVTATIAGLISGVNSQLNQAAKNYDVSISQMTKSNQEFIKSAPSFAKAAREIKGLTKEMYEAAKETGDFEGAERAASRLMYLNQRLNYLNAQTDRGAENIKTNANALISVLETPVDPNAMSWWEGYATEIEKINDALNMLNLSGSADLQKILEITPGWGEALASQSSEEMLRVLRSIDGRSPQAKAEIERIQNEMNELANGATIRPLGGGETPDLAIAKKRWQDWYGEIAKIDPAQFGDSGAKAAEIYLAEFSRSFEAGKSVFAELGEEFDIAGILQSQQAEIQKTLVELFSINPDDIDSGFTAVDNSISPLIEKYKLLGKEIKSLNDEHRRTEILAEYQKQIDEIGKSQNDLAIATYAATGATDEQIAAFKDMLDLRDELLQAEELKKTLEGIQDSLVNLGAGAALSGLKELGNALGQGKEAGEAMQAALVAMSQEILNALPTMFLQAGLQLIAQGQWALGLGFIAAAGSSALIGGYVNGSIQREQEKASKNAHGNIFDAAGIQTFARGGSFTNQVVQNPTFFRFARGTGLMGEAGPEAIMPLTRMPNGDLGVQTANGGSAQITVNIINNSGAEVRQEESDDGMGNKQIDVIIGEMVNRHIASGKADRPLGARYNLRAAGV